MNNIIVMFLSLDNSIFHNFQVLQLTGALSEHNVDFNVYQMQFKGVNDTDQWMMLYKPCSSTRLFLHVSQ